MSDSSEITSIGNTLLPIAENAVIAYLTIAMPWTASPLISWLVKLIVSGILNILFTKVEFGAYIIAITTTVNAENNDFKQAVATYQSSQTPETRAALISAASALIKLNAP